MSSSSSSQKLFAFGQDYYYALGGTEKVQLCSQDNDDDGDDRLESTHVAAHCMVDPPWQDDKDTLLQVVCSSTSTIFLTEMGHVYQCGTMHGKQYTSPTRVEICLPRKCIQVAAGRHFCIGRLENGIGVVSWGAGHFGQLGLGPHVSGSDKPQLIPHLLPQALGTSTRVSQVAAGSWHALAVLDNGRVMAWGSNRKYQCGVKSDKSPPTLCYPQAIAHSAKFTQVACGRLHSIGLDQEGRVYTWGASHFGQCGHYSRKTGICPPRLVEALSRVVVVSVVAGDSHSMALTGGGRVFSWGNGLEGQLGLGSVIPMGRPKLVADLDFPSIQAGQEWKQQQLQQSDARAYTASPPPVLAGKIPQITAIYASGSYSIAVSSAGHVYAWGYNDVGQLGLPRPTHELPLVDITSQQTMKQSSSGRLLQVQSFDSRCNVLCPRRVDALSEYRVISVAAGPCHLWCLGEERSSSHVGAAPPAIGRTLYEVQEERRRKGLLKLREQLSALAVSKDSGVEKDNEDFGLPDVVITPVASIAEGSSVTTIETQPSILSQPSVPSVSQRSSAASLSASQRSSAAASQRSSAAASSLLDVVFETKSHQSLKQEAQQCSTPDTATKSSPKEVHAPGSPKDLHMPLPVLPPLNDESPPMNGGTKSSPQRALGRSMSLSKLMRKKKSQAVLKSQYKQLTDSPRAPNGKAQSEDGGIADDEEEEHDEKRKSTGFGSFRSRLLKRTPSKAKHQKKNAKR